MTEHRVEDEQEGGCYYPQKHELDELRLFLKRPREAVGNKRLRKFVVLGEELLPGILNDITLELITPRISWRDLHVLRAVSRTWQQALRSHLVYESRVRSQSTETLALVAHRKTCRTFCDLSFYSPRDGTWNNLPCNTYLPEGILPEGECVSLHGKLYILGGVQLYGRLPEHGERIKVGSRGVHELDLTGQRRWKKCADMLEPRLKFGCGVIDGKIYVFGGTSHNKPLSGCEVYDPEVDTWSRIEPMKTSRVGHGVFKVGQKLFVHGGVFYHSIGDGPRLKKKAALSLEVYDPVKDKWRLIEPFERHTEGKIITVQGKVYLIIEFGIDHYDIDKLTLAHAQAFRRAGGVGWGRWLDTIVVDHELLALADTGLLRSKGFGNEKEDIVWEICAPPRSKPYSNWGWLPESMWAIQI